MKLPSVQLIANSFLHTVKRFPFVLLAALTATGTGIALVHGDYRGESLTLLAKLLMTGLLGLPLFFAVHVFCERTLAKPVFTFGALITALFVLVQFYFSLNGMDTDNPPIFYRFFFWNAGLHLLVAFSVFFSGEEKNGFWQFNKQLFLRFLTAGLYSAVLYVGLAGAILAVAQLFGIDFYNEVYADLWFIIAGLFNTIFFLGGISEPVIGLAEEKSYPLGLKIFTQYVLIPLVTVYLLILYAYTAKILVQMSLPKGWVANLILGFSVTGILSLVLVWPIREEEENKWIKTFSRFFYFSLVPLVTLLFVAIGTRIAQYGVTIERYIVAMLGTWLAVITLYFIFSKAKNIILIPITLSIFLFGSCFGPWGMFKVSERSQLKRLHILLEKNGAFMGSKLTKLSPTDRDNMKVKDRNQINSILEYLSENHGFEEMKDWLSADCQKTVYTDSLNKNRDEQMYALSECIGVYGFSSTRFQDNEEEMNLNFYCNQLNDVNGLDISGYDRIYSLNEYDRTGDLQEIDTSADSHIRLHDNQLSFYRTGTLQFQLQLDSIAKQLKTLPNDKQHSYSVTPADMTFEIPEQNGKKIKLMFSQFNVLVTDTSLNVNSINGYLLLK